MQNLDMTLLELIQFAKNSNSAVTQMRLGKEPKIAIIVILGSEECAEILPVIDSVTDKWNDDPLVTDAN